MQDRINLNIDKKKFSVMNIVIRFRTILIIILLLVIFTSIKPIFVHPTNLLNMLKSMSYTAIVNLLRIFPLRKWKTWKQKSSSVPSRKSGRKPWISSPNATPSRSPKQRATPSEKWL